MIYFGEISRWVELELIRAAETRGGVDSEPKGAISCRSHSHLGKKGGGERLIL